MRLLAGTVVLVAVIIAGCAEKGRGKPTEIDANFPRVQLVPQPDDQIAFEFDGREVLRYHFGASTPRPYFYPLIGPGGRPVTRIGHPQDPFTHRHHLSVWVGDQSVAGKNFWELAPNAGKIVLDRVVKIDDGRTGELMIRSTWIDEQGTKLFSDERVWTFTPRYETAKDGKSPEYFLDLKMTLTPIAPSLTLGKTNFGFLAVRVAKTMGVHDGGGQITNSEGKVGEKEIIWQRARWCDYSGQAAPGQINGIALLDHSENPRHPTFFHVRDDGWMGASFTREEPLEITKEKPLTLRYRLGIHDGACDAKAVEAHWRNWSGR